MQIALFPINALVKIMAKGDMFGKIGQVVGLGQLVGDVLHTVHISPPLANPGIPQLGINGSGTVIEVQLPASLLSEAGSK
jgi:hypothetical protein